MYIRSLQHFYNDILPLSVGPAAGWLVWLGITVACVITIIIIIIIVLYKMYIK